MEFVSTAGNSGGERSEDALKKKANALFADKKYEEADHVYSEAIAIATPETLGILYTNRAAGRINLERYEEALDDACSAITYDPKWMKAYHRKSTALTQLKRHRLAYLTWLDALVFCKADKLFANQLKIATQQWISIFRSPEAPVESNDDLVSRFQLLNRWERLSTLSHFWNDSNQQDRFQYFKVFLSLIGNNSELEFTPEHMIEMPMTNYDDFPREKVAAWCEYVQTQSAEDRQSIFKQIWMKLGEDEKIDIINDFKLLLGDSPSSISNRRSGRVDRSEIDNDLEELNLRPTPFSKHG